MVSEGALLMVRRGREPGRGLWSVPGGKVDRGEYLVDALRREVKEETGIDVEVHDLLGFFEVVGEDSHYVVLDFLATASAGGVPIPGDDVDDARWVPLDQVARHECTPRFIETLRSWGVLA